MATTEVGRDAEAVVAKFLESDGYKILSSNWRTRWCEIDIVAQKYKVIYFIEVKYRISDSQGSGFEYITQRKIQQIDFAARFWCSQNKWHGDYRIIGAEVTGLNF